MVFPYMSFQQNAVFVSVLPRCADCFVPIGFIIKYNYLRDGVPVKNTDENGVDEEIKIKIIDFDTPDNNDFLCVRELWVYGSIYHRRADIVGFVNGLPLLFVELKNHNVAVEDAFNNNYRDYLDTIPQLFYFNTFIIVF